jgi:hypothetical protein
MNELIGILKEMVMALSRYYLSIFLEGLMKILENLNCDSVPTKV